MEERTAALPGIASSTLRVILKGPPAGLPHPQPGQNTAIARAAPKRITRRRLECVPPPPRQVPDAPCLATFYPRRAVSRRDALLLLLLSAIWGLSFLFIKLGVDVLEPSVVVLGRLVFGALFLLVLLPGRGGLTPLRGHLRPLLVLGALNNALPFWLLGFAELRLDSGLTAVIQAAAPIFTVLLASRIDVSQRVTGSRLIGVGIGFLGVALLVGVQSGGNLVAALAVIAVALCYAISVLYAGRTVRGCRRCRSRSVSSPARQ